MKKLLHSSLLTFALIISGQSFARAGELIFGEGDKWVVFQGPILTEEMDGILSQLDDKKPEQILLNSVGGNLTGAIRFAKYVREKEMETWISRNQTCASACALIFFAGVERFSEGKLIVHQVSPTAGTRRWPRSHGNSGFHRCPEHGLANRNTSEQLWHTTICF